MHSLILVDRLRKRLQPTTTRVWFAFVDWQVSKFHTSRLGRVATFLVAALEICMGIAFGLIYLRHCAFRTAPAPLNDGKLCMQPEVGVSMQFTAILWDIGIDHATWRLHGNIAKFGN